MQILGAVWGILDWKELATPREWMLYSRAPDAIPAAPVPEHTQAALTEAQYRLQCTKQPGFKDLPVEAYAAGPGALYRVTLVPAKPTGPLVVDAAEHASATAVPL